MPCSSWVIYISEMNTIAVADIDKKNLLKGWLIKLMLDEPTNHPVITPKNHILSSWPSWDG